ncbi:MAG: 2-amino-4-hydroxy-6-hydroxymethyldihydropteridine diphosphokinase [Chlorobi bacterium]|nr:2-amino-4-hydroxy-6-hydroxymethyldihydropteridine diphosphokinase [Chlorobiota bacterium]
MKIQNIYILFGGNIGNSFDAINIADTSLEEKIGKRIKSSSFYETEPWGFIDENNFINKVAVYKTNILPERILEYIHEIESKLGRKRTKNQYSSRIIDIDILFLGNRIINTEKLQIPHPRIAERMFVLKPLFEIDPDFIHPIAKKTVQELMQECNDHLIVQKITNGI